MKCVQLPKRFYQKCPFCNSEQIMMMRGLVRDMEDFEVHISHDRGYSFCNCRNIFYTDYKNINKAIYDESYGKWYETSKDIKTIAVNEIEKLYPKLKSLCPDAKSFFEIGSIHDYVLDYMKEKGLEVSSLNICKRESKHPFEVADFEEYAPTKKYDIVFASHIFEHFKDPKKELLKCKEMLTDKGILYIAMPDTFFADFEGGRAQQFDWVVNEHYILWNMDNWIEFCEEQGLKCIYKERGLDLHKQKSDKWFWKQDFKIICK